VKTKVKITSVDGIKMIHLAGERGGIGSISAMNVDDVKAIFGRVFPPSEGLGLLIVSKRRMAGSIEFVVMQSPKKGMYGYTDNKDIILPCQKYSKKIFGKTPEIYDTYHVRFEKMEKKK